MNLNDLQPVRVRGFELRVIGLPLVSPFRTSFGTQVDRRILLVRAITDQGDGWGECVSGDDPLYSSEYVESSHHVMVHHLMPHLLPTDGTSLHATDVARLLEPIKEHRMAKGAIEAAVLDAQLRANNVSLPTALGSVRDRVPSGVSVGIHPTIDSLVSAVGGYLDEGYARIKLKIEPGWDIEPVRVIRETFGDNVPLQVDANTAYTRDDGPLLSQLDRFGLILIEQPLPEDDVTGHAIIAKQVNTPICLDESIVSTRAAIDAIERGACSIINIKAGRVGGYLEAVAVHDACRERGIPVWCGGMLETGIGRAMNLALAALPNFTITGDVSASERFWKRDIVLDPITLDDGHVSLRNGPGIGVDLDHPFIDSVTISRAIVGSD